MARLRYNGLSTTLGASLTSTDTSITFAAALTYANGASVPTIVGADYLPLVILSASGHLSEIVYLTAYTSGATTGTITRGNEGTTGVAHSSGDKVIQAPLVSDDTWAKIFTDDLSSQSGFMTALGGTWTINAGVLRCVDGGGGSRRTYNTLVVPNAVHAVEVEAAYISGSGTRRMGLLASSANAGSGSLQVYAESTNGTSWVMRADNDGSSNLYTSGAISYSGSGYLRIGAVVVGTAVDIYLNGAYHGTSIGSYTGGRYVGLWALNGTYDFRNLKTWTGVTSPF